MKELYFATGNARKIREATEALALKDVMVTPVKLDIEEMQNIDPRKVAEHKALAAFAILKTELVVNDTYWTIPSLHGFPGAYMKDIDQWFTTDDWQRLLAGIDRTIICHENVVYCDEFGNLQWFGKEFIGTFLNDPKGTVSANTARERLVSFDGVETLASLHDMNKNAFSPEEYCWIDFANWYAARLAKD